MKEQRNR